MRLGIQSGSLWSEGYTVSGLVRIVALGLLLIPLPYICRALVARSYERAEALSGICMFLDYAQREIRLRLTPVPQLVAGFLGSASVPKCVEEALLGVKGAQTGNTQSVLCAEDARRLSLLLSELGKDSADGELRRIDEARAYFAERARSEKERHNKDGRAYPLLTLGIGVGLFLLMI